MKIWDTNTHPVSTLLILFIVLLPLINSDITSLLAEGPRALNFLTLPLGSRQWQVPYYVISSLLLPMQDTVPKQKTQSSYSYYTVSYNWREKWLICVLKRTYNKPQSLGRKEEKFWLFFHFLPASQQLIEGWKPKSSLAHRCLFEWK